MIINPEGFSELPKGTSVDSLPKYLNLPPLAEGQCIEAEGHPDVQSSFIDTLPLREFIIY